jgi:hypothetical protein
MNISIGIYILISLIKVIAGTFICINDGMFENLNDLQTFWHYVHGNGYLKPCPANLIWSQITQRCVSKSKYRFASSHYKNVQAREILLLLILSHDRIGKISVFNVSLFDFFIILVLKPTDTTTTLSSTTITTTTTEVLSSEFYKRVLLQFP